MLWELLFALFGVTWVLPYSVRDTLSGWCDFNLGKKRRKVWKAAPLCVFWAVWKERNRIAFDNEELSMHRLKNSFVCNLWLWTKSVVNDGSLTLLSFFDWLGASWGLVLYFWFFLCPWAPLVYSLYVFGPASRGPFLIYVFCVFANQKKNEAAFHLSYGDRVNYEFARRYFVYGMWMFLSIHV